MCTSTTFISFDLYNIIFYLLLYDIAVRQFMLNDDRGLAAVCFRLDIVFWET